MPIDFECTVCKHKIRVPDGSEGKHTKCPKCNALLQVPDGSEDEFQLREPIDEPAPKPVSNEEVFGSFKPKPPKSDDLFEDLAPPKKVETFVDEEDEEDEPPIDEAAQAAALEKMKLPATVAIVFAGLAIVGSVVIIFMLMGSIVAEAGGAAAMSWLIAQLVFTTFSMAMQGLAIYGLRNALTLENYGLAWVGFVIAALPCGSICFLVSLPFCIWGIILLLDDGVKRQFSANEDA